MVLLVSLPRHRIVLLVLAQAGFQLIWYLLVGFLRGKPSLDFGPGELRRRRRSKHCAYNNLSMGRHLFDCEKCI